MSEMIERVARAAYFAGEGIGIKGAFDPRNDAHWSHWWKEDRASHEAVGRAVIEAMREPTRDMLSFRTDDAMVHSSCHMCGGHLEGWQLMIDAALDSPSQITPNQSSS